MRVARCCCCCCVIPFMPLDRKIRPRPEKMQLWARSNFPYVTSGPEAGPLVQTRPNLVASTRSFPSGPEKNGSPGQILSRPGPDLVLVHPGGPNQIYFWPRSPFSGPDRKSTRTRENPTRTRENPIWPREIRSGPEKIRSGPEKIRSGPDAKFVWARRSGALWTRLLGDQNQVWSASPTRAPIRVTACAVDQTAFRT